MSLPQRSPAPALLREGTYGQRAYARPTVPAPQRVARLAPIGGRPHPGVGPMRQQPVALRPAPAQPVGPMPQRPAPRPTVSFLTVAEVAAIMRVSKMTVYRLVHGGELAAVRVGRSFRVPQPAVRDYLDEARTDLA